MRALINKIESFFDESKDASLIFPAYRCLKAHEDDDDEFHALTVGLGAKHLQDFFAFPEFRGILQEEGNKDTLYLAIKAVKRVYEPPQTVTVTRSVRCKVKCYDCGNSWYSGS